MKRTFKINILLLLLLLCQSVVAAGNDNPKREFRGATYEIEISNPEKKYKDISVSVSVDGNAIDGNIVPSFADGKTHKVCVTVK